MRRVGSLTLLALATLVAACTPRLIQPNVLAHPAPGQVWGVAPFLNESGTSTVDGFEVADAFAIEAQQVYGVSTVPVNRVVRAMREAGLERITTPGEAHVLMNMLQLDALVLGSITTYDPYHPPTIGLAVELFRATDAPWTNVDPRALQRSPRGDEVPALGPHGQRAAVAQAAGVFEGDDHRTLAALEQYTQGRTAVDTAFGDRVYLYRMDLYTQFACYQLLGALLEQERARLEPVLAANP